MANFCPECGTTTIKVFDGGLDRDACPRCGWVQYASTAVGVGGLVIRDGRALLVERGIPPVGRWTIPSGWIEQEDNLAQAVQRELKEETDLDVTPLGIITVRNIPKDARNELYIVFLCEVAPDAQPVPDGDEFTQARFVHPDEFHALDISPFSRQIVEQYLAHRPQPWPISALDGYPFPGAIVLAPFLPSPNGSGPR